MEQTTLLKFLVASSPISVYIFLMTAGGRTSAFSATASFLLSLILSIFLYKTNAFSITFELIKGLWSTFTVATVILPAIFISRLSEEKNIFAMLKQTVEKYVHDRFYRILAVGWLLASLLQGLTGFGVPAAVVTPVLIGIGMSPLKAVLISIVGHAWGGTFGTFAIAFDNLIYQSGLTDTYAVHKTALYTGLLLWIFILISGATIYLLCGKKYFCLKNTLTVLSLSVILGGGQLLLCQNNSMLACVLPPVVAFVVLILADRLTLKQPLVSLSSEPCEPLQTAIPLRIALSPYYVLILLAIFFIFIRPVRIYLSKYTFGPVLPAGSSEVWAIYSPIAMFSHSGTLLSVSAVAGTAIFIFSKHLGCADALHIAFAAVRQFTRIILPVGCLILMSKVMNCSGQIETMSAYIYSAFKSFYPLLSPFIGTLGAFISSSNMSSNILFASFQRNIASLLNIDASAILAAQTAGGSIGNLLATSNIVMGIAATDGKVREGDVVKFLLPVCLSATAICGIAASVLCRLN